MGIRAHLDIAESPRVSPMIERNDLAKPPRTTYVVQFGNFDLYLDRSQIEGLYRDIGCLLGDPGAHARGHCTHAQAG